MKRLTARGKALSGVLFSLHDKPERIKALYGARDRVSISDVAILFGEVWTNSESLFDNQPELIALLSEIRAANVMHLTMDKEEQSQLTRLKTKGRVKLYRGAAQNNLFGFSWTTDEEKARWFAKRNALDGKPVLVTTIFSASDLMACFQGRGESEVVVDIHAPTAKISMEQARIQNLPSQKVSSAQRLFHLIQTSGDAAFGGPEAEQMKIQMMCVNMRMRDIPVQEQIAYLEKDAEKLESFGFTAKAAEVRKKAEQIVQMYDDPTTIQMADEYRARKAT